MPPRIKLRTLLVKTGLQTGLLAHLDSLRHCGYILKETMPSIGHCPKYSCQIYTRIQNSFLGCSVLLFQASGFGTESAKMLRTLIPFSNEGFVWMLRIVLVSSQDKETHSFSARTGGTTAAALCSAELKSFVLKATYNVGNVCKLKVGSGVL